MNKLLKNMPLLAFVLAAASALAFNMPAQDEETTVYGLTYDEENNEVWHPVDPDREGIDFQCNAAMSTCLYSSASTSSTPIKSGEFEALP